MPKFKVVIKGSGKLWDIDFTLKKRTPQNIPFKYSSNSKEWTSKEFSYTSKTMKYELVVYARRGTGWEGYIEEVRSKDKVIEWKLSKTNQDDKSVRSRPQNFTA